MQSPGRLPLAGDRWTPFTRSITFEGLDFTDAVFKMQVRDRKDGGQVRADLSTVSTASAEGVRLIYAGTDTIANHIAASRMDADDFPPGMSLGDNLLVSVIGIRINETTMEAMTPAPEIGGDATAYWDLHVTPSGGLKDLYLYETFIIRAGSTE